MNNELLASSSSSSPSFLFICELALPLICSHLPYCSHLHRSFSHTAVHSGTVGRVSQDTPPG
jgi:hypothetical protein